MLLNFTGYILDLTGNSLLFPKIQGSSREVFYKPSNQG